MSIVRRLRRWWLERNYSPELLGYVDSAIERTIRHSLAKGEIEVHPDDVDKPLEQQRFRAKVGTR